MILVGEEQQLGGNTLEAGSIESAKALIGVDAVVFLAMDAKDRCVPLVDKLVWTGIIGATGIGRTVGIPVSIFLLPVGEPCFFGVRIHRLQVEGTVVCDEAFETSVVMTGKIINGEATETGTYCSHAVTVNIG